MTQLTGQYGLSAARRALVSAAPMADWWQLAKPRLTLMVVITGAIGFGLGARDMGGHWSWLTAAAALLGIAMCCIGAGAVNQVLERGDDARMRRTMDRPLPAGRIAPAAALVAAAALTVGGTSLLALCASPLAAGLAALTVASYTLLYTPMKRITATCTIVGAIPGALPPVIGYAAAADRLGWAALLLFAILFAWQLPHFLAIAWLYRDDYARAGMPMLPVLDPDGSHTARHILFGCLALVPLSLAPCLTGMCGLLYFTGALGAGIAFLGSGAALVRRRSRRRARLVFLVSLAYLPLVFTLLLVDRL